MASMASDVFVLVSVSVEVDDYLTSKKNPRSKTNRRTLVLENILRGPLREGPYAPPRRWLSSVGGNMKD
jgi:hypothetical protein